MRICIYQLKGCERRLKLLMKDYPEIKVVLLDEFRFQVTADEATETVLYWRNFNLISTVDCQVQKVVV